MGVLTDTKQLSLATAETELLPKSGQTVIALVDPLQNGTASDFVD